jgi:twitching motility protein PilJ
MMTKFNKMRIWQKLAMIVLVMALPFVTLAYLLVNGANVQVNVAKDELVGVQYLQALRAPLEHVAQHGALSAAVIDGDKELRTMQLAARQTVSNDLDRLANVDRQLGAKLNTGSRVASIRKTWDELRSRVDNVNSRESSAQHIALSTQINDLLRATVDSSQLILDPDLDTYYLMDLAAMGIPETTQVLEQIRQASLTGQAVDSNLQDTVRGRVNRVRRSIDVSAEANSANANRASAAISSAVGAAETLIQLAATRSAKGASRDFYDRSTTMISEFYKVYDPLLDALSNGLNARIGRLRTDIFTRIAIAFVVLLAALGVAYWVYAGINRQLKSLTTQFGEVGMGNFEARAQVTSEDELGEMAEALNIILGGTLSMTVQSTEERDKMQTSIEKLLEEVGNVGQGDLTKEAVVSEDATGPIANSFNYMIVQLRQIIGDVQRTTQVVSKSASEIASTTSHLASGSETQSAQILDASASIDEMSVSIQQVSQSATQAAAVADRAQASAKQGAETVKKTIHGMESIRDQVQQTSKRIKRLGESSQEIGEIIQLISGIADRTSILALNASIQAAMAGEAGKGFAVVAEEVERLAERSTEATKKISGLIKSIQADTNEAMTAMEETTREVVDGSGLADEAGQRLADIEEVSVQLADIISGIAMAARQQARGSESVAKSVADISTVTQQTAAGAKQAATSIGDLAKMADRLRDSMDRFKLPA